MACRCKFLRCCICVSRRLRLATSTVSSETLRRRWLRAIKAAWLREALEDLKEPKELVDATELEELEVLLLSELPLTAMYCLCNCSSNGGFGDVGVDIDLLLNTAFPLDRDLLFKTTLGRRDIWSGVRFEPEGATDMCIVLVWLESLTNHAHAWNIGPPPPTYSKAVRARGGNIKYDNIKNQL